MRGKLYRPAQAVSGARITHAGAGKTVSVYPSAARASDHPRGCGENRHRTRKGLRSIGSPPRMRGKRRSILYAVPKSRITPADAGKTYRCSAGYHSGKDHPRGCGENTAIAANMPINMGSPPQVRGKPDIFVILILLLGITPAGAGKTDTGISLFGGNRDHPRRCGENAARLSIRCWFAGSPPQVRGKPLSLEWALAWRGITPAGAGKTVF